MSRRLLLLSFVFLAAHLLFIGAGMALAALG